MLSRFREASSNLRWPRLAGFVLATALCSLLGSQKLGILVPGLSQAGQSCGQVGCHGTFVAAAPPGGNGIHVDVAPSARSLQLGQAISVTTTVTGGQTGPGSPGGFNSYLGAGIPTTRGSFVAGSSSRVSVLGTEITHTDSTWRAWTYGFKASATTTGLVEMWVACLTADGDLMPTPNDLWAFHGYEGAATTSTPVRLYVNAARVVPFGTACVGSYGQHPVLGAPRSPNLGSTTFTLELHGSAPLAPIALLLGANPAWTPLDLSVINAVGCTLWVDPQVSVALATGPGNAQRAEGSAVIGLPIPSSPGLSGARLQVQVAIVDAANGRGVPITMTNALDLTLQ